ncbi:MAG: methionine--tRNA ligase [Bacteroidota bacterium]|nr:methionine--tRNA ligase [Bacteroidota bacterium]
MPSWKRILVTSALPYANGAVHLGHLAGAYLPADIFVRYQRLRGMDVLYLCGSDEHGVSVLISAMREGKSPQEIIDYYHDRNRRAFERAGIGFDHYSRTSIPLHHRTAQEWFLDLHAKNILRKRIERQLFDEKAGIFLPDRFVVGTCPHCGYERAYGDQCENCSRYYDQTDLIRPTSLLSGTPPVVREAEQWYFPLGEFQENLERYVESHAGDWKENVLQQVRGWLKAGLTDRPITRDMMWGVPVPLPNSEGKVIYVWFEAVLGYISAAKEWAERIGDPERWKTWWCDPVHTRYIAFIGKDNIVFHCLMFPAMLIARGRHTLPDNVPANEFLNLQGQKFSKSLNWSIEVDTFLDTFPPDPLRYTLTMIMPETRDSDFTLQEFQARNNNELVAVLGNFINRTLQFAHRSFGGAVPSAEGMTDADESFLAGFRESGEAVATAIERFRFRDALQNAMQFARSCNKYFNDAEPWRTVTTDPSRAAAAIYCAIQAVYALGIYFEPFLPFSAERVRAMLNLPPEAPRSWDGASQYRLPAGHQLGAAELLFRKIEDAEIEEVFDRLRSSGGDERPTTIGLPADTKPKTQPIKERITYEQFSKADLRVARVLEAERIPKSDKLLRMIVDIGSEKRQIVAGIGKAYTPDELVGKEIIVVANLEPTRLFGVESQGMLLAATTDGGTPVLVTPAGPTAPGNIVK